MASNKNGPSLSTTRGGEIYVGSEIRDSISRLDVLYANEFEEEYIDQETAEQVEVNFYRGASPQWLNYHIADQMESDGTGTPFIKRDGYNELVKQIRRNGKRNGPRTSTVKLLHQPGSGGTTLAMQVLWDLRKTFRSAVFTPPTSDVTTIANQVINIFTAGRQGHQNTVLLLLNDEHILDSLQDSIMTEIAKRKIFVHRPVVIFLNCVRKAEIQEWPHVIILKKELSDTEKQKFEEKQKELSQRYRNEHKQFHGFNIMRTNFSKDYVQGACALLKDVRKKKRPRKEQLAAFLSLLNAYVPGSYLLESQCQEFLGHQDPIYGGPSFEERMEPFTHLIITSPHEKQEKNVRMAHPMIAQQCIELMAMKGVTRSDIARNFLRFFCGDQTPLSLVTFVKDMLTKREMKREDGRERPMRDEESQERPVRREGEQERFSRLILDIQRKEGNGHSASVLKVASVQFLQNPFLPQALARFYYLELKDYNKGERWAKTAKERDPNNSFIADTLGQVHKHHLILKSKYMSVIPREILQLATKAIEAFKDEERLAENEQGTEMQGDGMTKVTHIFNNRGLFGYLQVANIVYESLVKRNKDWREVLTKKMSMGSLIQSLGDNKLLRYNTLIISLRDEVERKCDFFGTYLTYSKPGIRKDEPAYIWKDVSNCHKKYVGTSPPKHSRQNIDILIQKLKEQMADTFPGLLSCLDRDYTASQLQQITTWWEEICSTKDCAEDAECNYILANIILHNMEEIIPPSAFTAIRNSLMKVIGDDSGTQMPQTPRETPELYMLALLMFWPKDKEELSLSSDFNKLIQRMHRSYENAHKKHFRSRYLLPLLFLGKGEDLSRIVHRSVLHNLFIQGDVGVDEDLINKEWSNDEIFNDLSVQDRLLKVHGVVRNYRVYASFEDREIEVGAHLRGSVWKPGQVSFYLGFTIRGPVAFGIQYNLHRQTKEVHKDQTNEISPHKMGFHRQDSA